MRVRPTTQGTREGGGEMALAAVALVRPRLRGVLHQLAFPVSLLAGGFAILRAPAGIARGSTAVYAASLSTCLGVSALYHRGRWSAGARAMMRRLDHATIFLLIAGTFTPIAVIALSGSLSTTTLAVVWGGGVCGTLVCTLWDDAPVAVEVAPYLAVGAFGVVLLPHLLGHLGVGGTLLLAMGGAVYVAGALVFALHRPNPWPRTFGFHEIFHTMVLTAALLQWIGIVYWVIPAA